VPDSELLTLDDAVAIDVHAHQVLFGTDYPFITPERWLADFDLLDIKPDVRPLILKENAIRLLGLDSAPGQGT